MILMMKAIITIAIMIATMMIEILTTIAMMIYSNHDVTIIVAIIMASTVMTEIMILAINQLTSICRIFSVSIMNVSCLDRVQLILLKMWAKKQ